MKVFAVLLLAAAASAGDHAMKAQDNRVFPASTGPLTHDDIVPRLLPYDFHPADGAHAYSTVPATVYNNGFVNGYYGVPFTTYNGAPTTQDGVPVTTYNGVPITTFNGAPFNTYNGVHGFNVAPTPGFDAGEVYGYSFGPFPYAYSAYGHFPFAGFHGNVGSNFGEADVYNAGSVSLF